MIVVYNAILHWKLLYKHLSFVSKVALDCHRHCPDSAELVSEWIWVVRRAPLHREVYSLACYTERVFFLKRDPQTRQWSFLYHRRICSDGSEGHHHQNGPDVFAARKSFSKHIQAPGNHGPEAHKHYMPSLAHQCDQFTTTQQGQMSKWQFGRRSVFFIIFQFEAKMNMLIYNTVLVACVGRHDFRQYFVSTTYSWLPAMWIYIRKHVHRPFSIFTNGYVVNCTVGICSVKTEYACIAEIDSTTKDIKRSIEWHHWHNCVALAWARTPADESHEFGASLRIRLESSAAVDLSNIFVVE